MSDAYSRSILKGLRPQKVLSVSDWSDKNRVLTRVSSSEAGRWRTDRTPYLRKVMDCLSALSTYQLVVFMKGSQVGATEAGNNWIGYTIDHDPSPMLVIQPIDKLIKRFVKQRITPLIEGTPSIAQKFGDNKKDQSNTLEYKAFPGGALAIAGANSAPALRSMPAEKIFADEVDAYPKDVGGEGDPLSLAAARQRTFSKKKTFAVSTPVEENNSKIEELFKETCQQYFYVPCPECGHEQHLVWEQMRWEDDRPDTARYECIACGYKIANWQKTEMLDAGEWIPHEPDKLSSKKIGFHLNALYSPVGWLSWEEIVQLYLEALASADENKMKVFLNTILGETYKTKAEVPDHHRLWEQSRAVGYKANELPHDVLFLTAGVDIQKDRIELEIVGWCRDKVSYSIDYRVLIGDTSQPEVYRELDMLLTETFAYVDDPARGELKIAKMAIDTGYETQTVYNWARKHRGSRVMAIKGSEKQQVMVGQPKPVDIKNKGTYIKRGLRLWSIGVNIIKEELYSWLRQDMPKDGEQPPVGYCHFLPYGEEFFKQLTAERLIFKKVKGFEKTEWQKFRERNEALDCRVYNRAAASAFGIDRFRDQDWQRLEVATSWKPKENTKPVDKPITETKQPETKTQTPEPRPAKKAKKVKVKRSSYLHG